MLLKMLLKMCGIPEESAKHFICHALAMNATNFLLLFLPLDTQPSHLFCQMNFQFSTTFFQEKCSVKRKVFMQLSSAELGQAIPETRVLFQLTRTPLGIEFLFTAWKLSILNTFGSFSERCFKNSRQSFYDQKTSIKYASAPGAINQCVNPMSVL